MTDKPRITINDSFCSYYDWDGYAAAYLGPDTSCGVYGAQLDDNGKWYPAWIHPECSDIQLADYSDIQLADESFDTPHAAIKRSHTYFS